MSDEIGTYTFLPWLREGITNNVTAPTDPADKRGQISVSLKIDGKGIDGGADVSTTVVRDIGLYGPGDIVGIDRKTIVKTEPGNWITNFEPNYLPYIDFADEDFLWRYTPNAAAGNRLVPWLTLLVLRETEFIDGRNIANRPLPYFTLADDVDTANVCPPAEDLWAWAHVHINRDIVGTGDNVVSTNENDIVNSFKAVLAENPDLAYCRLIAPRKLDENTAYHAFLIPTFEAGRLAGLGHDPMVNPDFGANTIAWENYASREETKSFPYYHRWFFRTSAVGDFEYLVRLLKPKVADSRVGQRDIDVLDPGSNIAPIDDERLKGILRLGGALRFPRACLQGDEAVEYENYDQWVDSYPHSFQNELAAFINLADDYKTKTTATAHSESDLTIIDTDDDPDPLVTPPLYARWHSMTPRLLKQADDNAVANNQNWVHELNLDPRWRTVANFGTTVIQENQEAYMDAAWGQCGDILEANRRLQLGKYAAVTSQIWYKTAIEPQPGVAAEHYLLRTTPMHKRVLSGGVTVSYSMQSSFISPALVSAPMRRIVRPRGRLAKKLELVSPASAGNLLARANREEVSPAPPRQVPNGILSHQDISAEVRPASAPAGLVTLLARYPRLPYWTLAIALLLIVILLFFIPAPWTAIALVAAVGIGAFVWLRRLASAIQAADAILPEQQTPESVDRLPTLSDFRVVEFGDIFVPSKGVTDSPEATRFKTALRSNFDFVQRSAEAGKLPVYTRLTVPTVVNDITAGINPAFTIPRYLFGNIEIPLHIIEALQEKFVDVMAYPVIDLPMYEPLLASSTDNFVPNLNLVEQNSITLLETNQRFIEAYMVGLNHEFVREMHSRSFPTDMMATVFRQFWDVTAFLTPAQLDDQTARERLRDIPPLHRWSRFSALGDHDHRELLGDKEEEVVLVIRGELLKKYPTAVIYAHRAKWPTDSEGNRDLTKPREFDETGDPDSYIKMPLYQAKADPDIYFFGFDLTVTEAKGGDGEDDADAPGWFFVIKERPGEPRFGFDVPGEASDFTVPKVPRWNDLSWTHVMESVAPDKFLSLSGPRAISITTPGAEPTEPGEAQDAWQQATEDTQIEWKSSMDSAELAYILYQVPVLVGVHAAEMLPDECNAET